jgi:hypothetical protein
VSLLTQWSLVILAGVLFVTGWVLVWFEHREKRRRARRYVRRVR